jgi:hypothetical protein
MELGVSKPGLDFGIKHLILRNLASVSVKSSEQHLWFVQIASFHIHHVLLIYLPDPRDGKANSDSPQEPLKLGL